MSVFTGKDYKFFFCLSCSLNKPLAKKLRIGKFRVTCTDCRDRAAAGKGSSWISRGSRGWADEERADAIPQSVADAYREAVSE